MISVRTNGGRGSELGLYYTKDGCNLCYRAVPGLCSHELSVKGFLVRGFLVKAHSVVRPKPTYQPHYYSRVHHEVSSVVQSLPISRTVAA